MTMYCWRVVVEADVPTGKHFRGPIVEAETQAEAEAKAKAIMTGRVLVSECLHEASVHKSFRYASEESRDARALASVRSRVRRGLDRRSRSAIPASALSLSAESRTGPGE